MPQADRYYLYAVLATNLAKKISQFLEETKAQTDAEFCTCLFHGCSMNPSQDYLSPKMGSSLGV